MNSDKVRLYLPHGHDRLFIVGVGEIDRLENLVEANDVLLLVNVIIVGIFGKTGLHIVFTLPVVEGIDLLKLLLDVVGVGEPAIVRFSIFELLDFGECPIRLKYWFGLFGGVLLSLPPMTEGRMDRIYYRLYISRMCASVLVN